MGTVIAFRPETLSAEEFIASVELPKWCHHVLNHDLLPLSDVNQFRLGLIYRHFYDLETEILSHDILMAVYNIAEECGLSREQAIALSVFGLPETSPLQKIVEKPQSSLFFLTWWDRRKEEAGIYSLAKVIVEIFRITTKHHMEVKFWDL